MGFFVWLVFVVFFFKKGRCCALVVLLAIVSQNVAELDFITKSRIIY